MMRRFIFRLAFCPLLVYACLSSASALAVEQEPRAASWTVAKLMLGMSQVKKSRATFAERKYLSIMDIPLSSSGTLEYIAPDRLVKHTLRPKPEKLTLNKDKLVIQSGGAGEARTLSLQEFPSVWAFVESIRSTLAGDAETLNRFYKVSLKGHQKQWQLTLRPTDPQTKNMVNEILIMGSMDQINTIEIHELGGDYSVMSISRDDS